MDNCLLQEEERKGIMGKRGLGWLGITIIVLVVLVLIAVGIFAFAIFNIGAKNPYAGLDGEVTNPAEDLTVEEAVEQFNESFVFYLLYSIEAYTLHNPPFSSDKPKIEFLIDTDVYNAVITDGMIDVSKGPINDEDAVITTSTEEAVKMIKDESYIEDSFRSGLSQIELISGKTKLASKGYLGIFQQLTGE